MEFLSSSNQLSKREHNFGYLGIRLARVFARRKILSEWGLQYRLCEVGPAKLDPLLLADALRGDTGSRREPTRPFPGLLADPLLDARDALDLANEAVEAAALVAATTEGITAKALAEAIFHRHSIRITDPKFGPAGMRARRRLAASEAVAAHSVLVNLRTHSPVRIWILNDLSWLYPDDTRLWNLLCEAEGDSRRLLIVARKIAPLTFTVLKAMGARAVQYYSMLSDESPDEGARLAADAIGLPHLLPLSALAQHQVTGHIGANLAALNQGSRASELAVANATALGFGQWRTPTPRQLIRWAKESRIETPSAWDEMMTAWSQIEMPQSLPDKPLQAGSFRPKNGDIPNQNDAALRPDDPPRFAPRRIPVVAEVDLATWDRLNAKLRADVRRE